MKQMSNDTDELCGLNETDEWCVRREGDHNPTHQVLSVLLQAGFRAVC